MAGYIFPPSAVVAGKASIGEYLSRRSSILVVVVAVTSSALHAQKSGEAGSPFKARSEPYDATQLVITLVGKASVKISGRYHFLQGAYESSGSRQCRSDSQSMSGDSQNASEPSDRRSRGGQIVLQAAVVSTKRARFAREELKAGSEACLFEHCVVACACKWM